MTTNVKKTNERKYKIIGDLPVRPNETDITVECPFCSTQFTVTIFCLAGKGYPCKECGAIHCYKTGTAVQA